MTANELATLGAGLLAAASVLIYIYMSVPSAGRSSLLIEMSRLREELAALRRSKSLDLAHGKKAAEIDSVLVTVMMRGPIPSSILVPALLARRRRGAERDEEHELPVLTKSSPVEHWQLFDIERRMARSLLRSSIMCSSVWFLAWPIWIARRGAFGPEGPLVSSPTKAEPELIAHIDVAVERTEDVFERSRGYFDLSDHRSKLARLELMSH